MSKLYRVFICFTVAIFICNSAFGQEQNNSAGNGNEARILSEPITLKQSINFEAINSFQSNPLDGITTVDFKITALGFDPDPVKMNETATITVTAKNSGDTDGSRELVYYLSEDDELNTSEDVELGTDEITLAAGTSGSEDLSFTPENISDLSIGDYYVMVAIPDQDEFWYLESTITIDSADPPVDFSITSIDFAPDPVKMDESATISTDIENIGDTEGSRNLVYFLSEDQELDTSEDVVVDTVETTLAAGANVTEDLSFIPENISGLWSGIYFVYVYIPGESDAEKRTESITIDPADDTSPLIRVDKEELNFILEENSSGTQNLSITNTGDATLNWSANLVSNQTNSSSGKIKSKFTNVDPFEEIDRRLENQSRVPVIVEMEVTDRSGTSIAGVTSTQKRKSLISSTTEQLVSGLEKQSYSNSKKYKYTPYWAATVDGEALDRLRNNPKVKKIHPDKLSKPALRNSTPVVGADESWTSGFTGDGQAVVILDTGVDTDHSFLADKTVAEACYSTTNESATSVCPNGNESETGSGSGENCDTSVRGCDHGTHVAGIAAGDGSSSSGVAKGADIIPMQVFSKFSGSDCSDGTGPCVLSYTSDQISALERVNELREDYDIAAVNMSLGGGRSSMYCQDDPRIEIINILKQHGIATVIASGNDGYVDAVSYPACIASAVSVGSTQHGNSGGTLDNVSEFSNSADILDLLAPGESIESSIPGGAFGYKGGTSMGAPHVAGAWAILKEESPEASVDDILLRLINSGKKVTDSRNGITKPRIQIDKALEISSWLQLSVISGNIYPGSSETVTLDFNTSDLSPGEYNGTVQITSNDEDINIPVSLTVKEEIVAMSFRKGWNLIGLSAQKEDPNYLTLFPNIAQKPYTFDGNYQNEENLQEGTGYWAKIKSDSTFKFSGSRIDTVNLDLNKGWNLISGISQKVAVENIDDPQQIFTGTVFGFNGMYFEADSLTPGQGYWLKAKAEGTIEITKPDQAKQLLASDNRHEIKRYRKQLNKIVFNLAGDRNSSLYFGKKLDKIAVQQYSMPPLPPRGSFDVRFAKSGSYYSGLGSPELNIQIPEGSTVSFELNLPADNAQKKYGYQLLAEDDLISEGEISDSQRITLTDPTISKIKLNSTGERKISGLAPDKFKLSSNYPNPFNPTTTIPYQVPETVPVKIDLFNIIGRQVTTLVDKDQSPGFYEVKLDGSNLSSGMYFYRIQAGDFTETKKLLLIK